MQHQDNTNRIGGLSIAYIGGGSRSWARTLMLDLAGEEQLSGSVRLYDIDRAAAEENALMGNRLTAREDVKGKWSYEAVSSIGDALTGADFVVLSILPGTFEEMRSDVHAPEQYGVYQAVGDTVGPGGVIRALRTIPLYMGFAESIRQHCPDAWVINYTNPMTVCTRTLYEVFPGIKAFGCCHEVFGVQELAADLARSFLGLGGVTRRDIHTNVLGINHFTWIDRIGCGSHDLMPLFRDVAEKYAEEGYSPAGDSHEGYFAHRNMVKLDLLRRYGVIAAAGDRHLAEFMPPDYLRDPDTVRRWGFALTPVSWRIEDRKKIEEYRRQVIEGSVELELRPTGEEGILQIKALLGLGDIVTNVNLPNRGQAEGLPLGAVVETNALFARDCLQPVFSGRLPAAVNSMVLRHVGNQEALVQASVRGDRELAFHAFVNDPLLSRVPLDDAKKLFKQMLANTANYLPEYLR